MLPSIPTRDTKAFHRAHVRPEPALQALLRTGFEQFFVVRLEEMYRLMRLPVPPTRTSSHLLVMLTEGAGRMSVGSENYPLAPGDCLLVPAGQVFAFGEASPHRGYLCSFHPSFFQGRVVNSALALEFDFLRIWGMPFFPHKAGVAEFVRMLLERLRMEYAATGLASRGLLQAYLAALLCELNQAYQPAAVGHSGRATQLANKFRELLLAHFKTQQLVADYATQLCVSPNHLNKAVKAATGKSPTKWIAEAIVLEAKVLLHQSGLPVGEVAAEVGLTDASYFSRLFKKHQGLTPLEFRRRIEKS
ncbi:helix-turn-helix domain-containing protein [Hymenobacter negativus]|uniref:AraC family transcriptional regulator n=1 Tax=Hymenobacter negativus TaxID=2795026 RepID=A0ABS3QKC5_9BACT|nr:helix-turn-helix domain-containing protein [Hymenobacter negativus]MBO2011438.1 AraC family transcriptional regulator [Hymenobacter negativus]